MRTHAIVGLGFFCGLVATGARASERNGMGGEKPPLRVFILAGQSNMAGPGVVDLDGPNANGGRGTLVRLFESPATRPLVEPFRNADGSWRRRDDVFVRYTPEGEKAKFGPLGPGFTPHDGEHHFGPEWAFGEVMGAAIDGPVLLVKAAWGGKALSTDFRPPSSGGTVGPYYSRMIEDVREAIRRAPTDIPGMDGRAIELAGLVWYHGWNDGCDPDVAVPQYAENLANLIRDVRRDLSVPDMPVVVGEITGPWIEAPGEWGALRAQQAKAAALPEWKGRVAFVPTAAYIRDRGESPHPTHDHHEWGNAETYIRVGDALGRAMRALTVSGSPAFVPDLPGDVRRSQGELSGYMLVPLERVPESFNAGFSLYAAAWPLVEHYPGSNFQTGLFGTWMFPQWSKEDKPEKLYTDIEGGLGWWRDTRFATETPKFIMGGVAANFSAWANGPGAGKGRDWDNPLGKYAIAQLSPWVLWPPDGLNLAQGTCGELFGYGYLPLPIIDAKATTAGAPVPTGDRCWTLFLNTANFKGPVTFFTPFFWSEATIERRDWAGKMLDSRPSDPNKAFQMETQWVPATLSRRAAGGTVREGPAYARTAPVSFPMDEQGRTVVLHKLTCYTPEALTEPVRRWFAGGEAASGTIAATPGTAHVQQFKQGGGSTWRIFADGTTDDQRPDLLWSAFGTPTTPIPHDSETYGYAWDKELVREVKMGRKEGERRLARLPEFYRLEERHELKDGKPVAKPPRWVAVPRGEVPREAGLHDLRFETPREPDPGAYVTPDAPDSPYRSPGPAAGPYEVTLGDGSVVTYAWYRFADQPAMLRADLSPSEREVAQKRVEMLHRAWTKEREYLPPPSTGTLASLDPALLVTPPAGMEVGYVPIVLKQEKKKGH